MSSRQASRQLGSASLNAQNQAGISADRARQEIDDIIRTERVSIEGTAAFVGGSVARGWSNESSDYDLYLISDDMADLDGMRLYSSSRSVDIHVTSPSDVERLLRDVGWARVSANPLPPRALSIPEKLLLERLCFPIAVSVHDVIAGLQTEVLASAFMYVLVSEYFSYVDDYVEDCLGQRTAGDVYSAVLSAHSAVMRAVDGLLSSVGRPCINTKWRARAVQEGELPLIGFSEYWALETMATLEEEGYTKWTQKAMAWARLITSATELPRRVG